MDQGTEVEVLELQVTRGVMPEDKIVHLYERWAKVLDNIRYMGFEHQQKEKEFGMKWRLAYKVELEREA